MSKYEPAMIERIARAIASKAPGLCASRKVKKFPCLTASKLEVAIFGGEVEGASRCYCFNQAKAVIEAIREPTGSMIDAGAASLGNVPSRPVWDGFPSKTWRAMIDAMPH